MSDQRDVQKRRMFRMFLSIITTCGLVSVALAQTPLAHLRVITIRKMTEGGQSIDASENVRARYAVRFRLEVSGDQAIYLLTEGTMGAPPLGHALKRHASSVAGPDGGAGSSQSNTSGIKNLTKETGARWIMLPPSAGYEWEIESEPSLAGVEESRGVILRKDMDSPPIELFSSWYTVGDKMASVRGGRSGR